MAGGGGGAAPSTPSGQEARFLQIADATRIGSDLWTQASDVITATIPIPAGATSTLGGAAGCVSFLLWDLGPIVGATGALTVADLSALTLEMEIGTFPSGTGVGVLLPFGFVFSSAAKASVDFTADKSRWSSVFSGPPATAGTTVSSSAQNNNLNPASGAVSSVTCLRAMSVSYLHPRATIFECESFAALSNASAVAKNNNTNGDDMTSTWNVYAFIAAGRSITSGSTETPTFKLKAGALRRTAA